MINLQESALNRNFIKELKPLIIFTKASAWEAIGSQVMTRVNVVNAIKLYGK